MALWDKIFTGKNAETGAKVLEEGVEKIVQYGQRILKVMKPQTQVFSHYNGGMAVPQSMEGYYAKAGMQPIGHSLQTTKEVYVIKDDTVTNLLATRETKFLDGAWPVERQVGKDIILSHNYGTKNAYQNTLSINSAGKRTFYSNY